MKIINRLYRLAAAALFAATAAAGFVPANAAESQAGWALTKVPVACVRDNPSHAAELGSQVVMGTPVKTSPVEGQSDWLRVETPEGYSGYIIANSLQQMSPLDMRRWINRNRLAVSAVDPVYIVAAPDGDPRSRISDVVNGSILTATGGDAPEGFVAVVTPDGRKGYIPSDAVQPLEEWAHRNFSTDAMLDMAFSLMGSPYLWGGTSTKGVDCSGLTKVAFMSQGVILPRNASQQARIGTPLDINRPDRFMPGDLLFFGSRSTGRVNHVGIYLGSGRFIHCSGRVRVNSLIPSDPDYMKLHLLSATRLDADTLRRLSLLNSPFYFSHTAVEAPLKPGIR